jgi:hypothetical protein
MRIGVVKEIKPAERRVALTSAGTHELIGLGASVMVEAGAGVGSGFTNDAYTVAGARIVSEAAEVWQGSELLLKVKEPIEPEYPLMHGDLTMFTYFHFAPARARTEAILNSGATAIAYETVETADGHLPLLAPMSEIAGRLAAHAGHTSCRPAWRSGCPDRECHRSCISKGPSDRRWPRRDGRGADRPWCRAGGDDSRALTHAPQLDQYFAARARILMSDKLILEAELLRSRHGDRRGARPRRARAKACDA